MTVDPLIYHVILSIAALPVTGLVNVGWWSFLSERFAKLVLIGVLNGLLLCGIEMLW